MSISLVQVIDLFVQLSGSHINLNYYYRWLCWELDSCHKETLIRSFDVFVVAR